MTRTSVTPRQFLRRLFGNLDRGHLTLFSIDPTTSERFTEWFAHDDLDAMADRAVEVGQTRDTWFGLAPRIGQLPQGRRGGSLDCIGITCLWVDIDIAGPNHADIAGVLPTLEQARAMVVSFPLQPSITIATGGGYHAYWPLDELIEQPDAQVLLDRWAATWSAHAIERKAHVDNVFDVARVLRMPGTLNHKNDELTPTVNIVKFDERAFSYSDIFDITIDPPTPDPYQGGRRMPYTGTERPGDDFNSRHSCGEVFAMDGWTLSKVKASSDERWLHPWNPTSDESATVFADDGHATVWSDTVPQHRLGIAIKRPYDPFGLFAALFHDGDHREASIELAKRGYGASRMREMLGYNIPVDLVTDDVVTDDDGVKPGVIINGIHLDELADKVVRILVDSNSPPRLFRHGQTVSQFTRSELEPVDRGRMIHIAERTMRPYRASKQGALSPARLDVATLDLAMLRLLDELPAVQVVMRSPFLRSDGTICAEVGYDRASCNYLAATVVVDVATNPTPMQIADAVALVDDLLRDFPLSTASDRAHIFALLLTPLVRHLVPLTPLYVLDGNGPGVGKNLLAECCMYIATGGWIQTDPLPLDAEEQRKQITALLSTGRSVALFDEAHIISGTSLSRLITSTTWGDRLLGYSKQVAYPNRITVVALGNNVEVQGDLPRRSIIVRLESQLARPYDRQDFHHSDLRSWVEEQRPALLTSLLTILIAWRRAGSPVGSARLGSFDAWAQIIGGALAHAGVDGFLGNVGDMRSRAASDDSEMEAHLEELWKIYGSAPFSTRQVAEMIDNDRLDAVVVRGPNDRQGMAKVLGHLYRRYSGRRMDTVRIVPEGITRGARRWVLEQNLTEERGGLGGWGGSVLPITKTTKSLIYRESPTQSDAEAKFEAIPNPPHPPHPPLPMDEEF